MAPHTSSPTGTRPSSAFDAAFGSFPTVEVTRSSFNRGRYTVHTFSSGVRQVFDYDRVMKHLDTDAAVNTFLSSVTLDHEMAM